jgi:hypothetical protein
MRERTPYEIFMGKDGLIAGGSFRYQMLRKWGEVQRRENLLRVTQTNISIAF